MLAKSDSYLTKCRAHNCVCAIIDYSYIAIYDAMHLDRDLNAFNLYIRNIT